MTTRYFGERITRSEDPRLLTGRGTYVDDVQPYGCLHAAVLRSPHAHARISGIDTSKAKALRGVIAVYTNTDLSEAIAGPLPKLIPHPSLIHHKTQYALVPDTVRHVGEAVAFVVAESRYIAEDALDLVRAEEVEDLVAAGREELGDEAAVAPLPGRLCAQEARRGLRERLGERPLPLRPFHPRCIAAEGRRRDAVETLLAGLSTAPPAELRSVAVADPGRRHGEGQGLPVELRVPA